MMENGQGTGAKLGLPPLTPDQQEALQKVIIVLYCFTFFFYFLSLLEMRGEGVSTGHGPNSNLHHLLQCVKSLHTTAVPQLHLIIDS